MTSAAFDTDKAVKTLTEAGVNERLAAAVATVVGDAMTVITSQMVTKDDLEHWLNKFERRMTIRLSRLIAIGFGIIAVLNQLLD